MHEPDAAVDNGRDTRLAAESERLTWENVRLTAENVRLTAALARLHDEEARRDQYLALVSHELRTPLTVVLGLAQTLVDRPGVAASADGEEILRRIVRQGRRLRDMVELLLRTSARTADLTPAHADEVQPEDVLEEVVADRRAADPSRVVRLDLPTRSEPIAGDPEAVRIVLANLVDNAFKHTPEDCPIDIALDRKPGCVRISVADRGVGVAPADRGRIFDAFTQLDEPGGHGSDGVGLGLFLVERLVERMGGRVWVEDRAGGGARFVVELVEQTEPAEPLDSLLPG